MIIGSRSFDTEHETYIMGILNVTPDSFSDGGCWSSIDTALEHVREMIGDGADIIDVGGESTRPGHIRISEEEEKERVLPYIEAVKANFDIPVSIDTYKAGVAKAAVLAGADMINDIWGFKGDERIAQVAAEHNTAYCIMHNRDITLRPYQNLMQDIISDLKESINIGLAVGVKPENMIVDPGIGFGKTLNDNLLVMNNLELLQQLKCPVLLGTSRKSMIGLTLELPVGDRTEGTVATSVIGVMKGCAFIRVHDVKENCRAVRMTRAILNAR